MLQLIINGVVCDLPSDPKVAITYEANNIGNLADRNGSFANTFDLPLTGNNRRIFGLSDQVGSAFDTGATLPVQAFYTNWLIFEGVCRVVRYFGNNLQVELIGGVGTLVEALAAKTLADFDYKDLPDSVVGLSDVGTSDVKLCRMDGGTWGLRKEIPVGGTSRYMFIYPEETAFWYRLSKVFAGLADGLGVTISLPDDFEDLYLAQGSFGKSAANVDGVGAGTCADVAIAGAATGYHFATRAVEITTTTAYFDSVEDSAYSNNGAYVRIRWDFEFEFDVTTSGVAATLQVMQEAFIGNSLVAANITTEAIGAPVSKFEISGGFEFDVNLCDFNRMVGGMKMNLRIGVKNPSNPPALNFVNTTPINSTFTVTPYDRQCADTYVTPTQAMPKITVADFFLDICQRFGYTVSYDDRSKTIAFVKQSNLDNRTLAVDWNGKVESPLDSQFGAQYQTEFVFGTYARRNRYISEDKADFAILEANVDTPIEADAYTSIMNTPVLSTIGIEPYSIGQWTNGGDQMRWPIINYPYIGGNLLAFHGNWWEAKDDVTLTIGVVPGSYTVNQSGATGLSITTPWQYTTLDSVFTNSDKVNIGHLSPDAAIDTFFPLVTGYGYFTQTLNWMDDTGLTWQSALDTRYQWLSAILSNPRIHRVLVRIRPTDLPLAFDKPIYWNQAYWYLVSVQDYTPMSGENTVCVLAQIPDYPTS